MAMDLSALWVFCGAGAGAVLRWQLGVWFGAGSAATALPWGTFAANALGGLLVGVALGAFAHPWAAGPQPLVSSESVQAVRLLAVTGFLGGLTTFSTFSAEVVQLAVGGRWVSAVAWAALHLCTSLGLTLVGWWLSRP